jgi:hypothetical protein
MSSSRFVKTPTLVAVVPTSVEAPAVEARTCSRSGNTCGGGSTVRVQKLALEPGIIVTSGVSSQFEIVATPAPFW